MPNHLPTGDFPNYDPASFTVLTTATMMGVCSTASYGPVGTITGGVTTGTVTVAPNTTYTYPYVNTPNYGGGMVWGSTNSFPFAPPEIEWTHRIWFNEHWTYYMQTSNEAEDILMNKRKIKQSCLLS
jgi:hypothetical protein